MGDKFDPRHPTSFTPQVASAWTISPSPIRYSTACFTLDGLGTFLKDLAMIIEIWGSPTWIHFGTIKWQKALLSLGPYPLHHTAVAAAM
jgi:hypothetical protein